MRLTSDRAGGPRGVCRRRRRQAGLSTSARFSNDHTVAAASTNAKNIKASAGLLAGVRIFNNAPYPIFVKFHNTAGVPTAGAGVVKTIGVQAGMPRDVEIDGGHYFSTGIGMSDRERHHRRRRDRRRAVRLHGGR
jgi:hypothetical protein